MSSIHEAAVAGNIEVLKLLIDNGADVNLKDSKSFRPIHYAAWQGQTEAVFILLRCGANVNEQSLNGDTPLHLASQYGHLKIVQLLVFHHAEPSLLNRRLLTSMELACEHGHYQVVNFLLHNTSCQQMILNHNHHDQHTPLHLAAKNGHTDIVRLLLLSGIDINRLTTTDGTALHVACRNGRYETAKLLLECGIDVHLRNGYDQTPSQVVIKQKSGNDIKRLIKEFSEAISVRAVQPYTNSHVGALKFVEGDCITVLDHNPTGQWRGFILQEDLTTRSGYFPSTYVQLDPTGYSTSSSPHLLSINLNRSNRLRVASATPTINSYVVLRHYRSCRVFVGEVPSKYTNVLVRNSKESQAYNSDHSPLDSDPMSRISQTDSGLTTVSSWSAHSRRDSPTNNTYRHSAASSIDSGRSSTAVYDSPKTLALSSFVGHGDARSMCSTESRSSDPDKTSYRSSDSSLDESGTLNIMTLLRNDVSDSDIIFAWLREFCYENYAENFIKNGYDIQTIVRMTPADLTAIGITHPSHRRKIKNEIARLQLSDGLPDFIPDTLYEWLRYLRLDQYTLLLTKQNYKQLTDVINIAWEDLEDIGITRLGHQKRFMLGVKRLIDVEKGQYPSRSNQINPTNECGNSLENQNYDHKALIRTIVNVDSVKYATLRRSQLSPNLSAHKPCTGSSGGSIAPSSFRLPPPLSSLTTNLSVHNYETIPSSRGRSLENINSVERTLDIYHRPDQLIPSQYAQPSIVLNNLQFLDDIDLSSSTESTNGIPFANENIGTIKQRSLVNHYNSTTVQQSLDTMKRSLPMEFFQQTNGHSLTSPMVIYDNSERFLRKTTPSPSKQMRTTPFLINGHDLTVSNVDKRSQYIDAFQTSKVIKNDTTNVLSDIDSMLSDLNRELDQMLDYDPVTSRRISHQLSDGLLHH